MRLILLAALAATFLIALSYQNKPVEPLPHKPEEKPYTPHQATTTESTKPTESTQSNNTPSEMENSSTNRSKTLTPAEINKYISWMESRGFDLKTDEPSTSNKSSSNYLKMDKKKLLELAEQWDAKAAQALAENILSSGQHGKSGLPARALQEEAIQLLIKATVLGYTSSAERLMEVYRQRAMYIGEQTRIKKEPFDREALAEAYKYAFFLAKRGDINDEVNLAMLKSTGQLYPYEIEQARFRADQIYYQMLNQRSHLGLPAFEDGVPDDIKEISKKIIEATLQ